MSNQENGGIKQLKLRIPMAMYQQLVKDAAKHSEPPATRARHILGDALMGIELTDADKEEIKRLTAENWAKIRGGEVMNELEVSLASFDYEALVELAAEIGISAEDLALFFISREVVHTSKNSTASRPLLFLPEGGSHLTIEHAK